MKKNLVGEVVTLKTQTEIIVGRLQNVSDDGCINIEKPHVLVPHENGVHMFPYQKYFPFFKSYDELAFKASEYVISEADDNSKNSYIEMTSKIIKPKTPSIIL